MVALSGTHSIGRSQCSSFADRVPPPSGTTTSGSDMDADLVASLRRQCTTPSDTVAQDAVTPNALDNQYYKSDAALMTAADTMGLVRASAYFPGWWNAKFAEAMVKMGAVAVKTAGNGEIRKQCRFPNY
ncbi:peroxidase 2-like [Oryza glaberrima]|uniref:peroxidase 2-like n=1 Tax=Oryza glaberrima TaxID=4538 RepID=UPI00224C01B8|nr:peroxidase 2-like [Oryza glaberrima]